MNWLVKISQADQYLATLGASPEIVQWVLSQPNAQFYINEFRQSPNLTLEQLQSLQSPEQESPYTSKELERTQEFVDPFKLWTLVQLKKMRIRPDPIRFSDGNVMMDYDYGRGIMGIDRDFSYIYDWWRFTEPRPDIASYTFEAAMQAQEMWHREAAGAGKGMVYEKTNPELIVFGPPEWEGWSIQKVMSKHDLSVEGSIMDNCVGKYGREVASGNSEIYSLRDPENQPYATIELNPRTDEVIQIEGRSHADPEEEHKEYIKAWFSEFRKTKPNLMLGYEEPFDFDDLRYVESSDIDEEINRIVYKGSSDYGLEPPLDQLDIQNAYDAVINSISGHNAYRSTDDTSNVSYIGAEIANVAWSADKYRAQKFNMDNPNEEQQKKYKYESRNYGVDWLWEKIEDNNINFYDTYDQHETYVSRENFDTDEEFEKAEQDERDENERGIRGEYLPWALDDEIAKQLIESARTDPFLKEHRQLQPQVSVVASNWLKNLVLAQSQKLCQIPESYTDIGHGPEGGSRYWEKELENIIIWWYEDGQIVDFERTEDNDKHRPHEHEASGRVDVDRRVGSVVFREDLEEGFSSAYLKKRILNDLVSKYVGIKFTVFAPGGFGSGYPLSEYWEMIESGQA